MLPNARTPGSRGEWHPNVVINRRNSGADTSRNIGYSRAMGEYMTIFDGDDWGHPQQIPNSWL